MIVFLALERLFCPQKGRSKVRFSENLLCYQCHGPIITFTPFPKNPLIGAFLRKIGRADELGSGVRNLMKYGKAYGGQEPELIEGDIFRIIVGIPDSGHLCKSAPKQLTGEVTGKSTGKSPGKFSGLSRSLQVSFPGRKYRRL